MNFKMAVSRMTSYDLQPVSTRSIFTYLKMFVSSDNAIFSRIPLRFPGFFIAGNGTYKTVYAQSSRDTASLSPTGATR